MATLNRPRTYVSLRRRTVEAIRRGEQLSAASTQLMEETAREQQTSRALLRSLAELKGFVAENCRDIRTMIRKR